MNQKRKAIIEANEISDLRTVSLGGYLQKILIEGKYRTNPIFITLHGGPGSPFPFNAGCRGLFPEPTEHFIMVYWDQLGCGINNCTIDDSFTISHFVHMTVDLIREMHKEFPENSINLFGVSWGSILAAKAAEAVPELLNKVMVYGQVLKNLVYNEMVHDALKGSSLPDKQKQQLERMMQEKHPEEQRTIMKWIQKYTEGYQCKAGGKTPMGSIIRGLLTSPDYSLKDFKAMVFNGTLKNGSLMKELMEIDLSDTLQHITIPYLILQGNTDLVTPTKIMQLYIADSANKNLRLHLVANSGHMPSASGMDAIMKMGLDFLLAV